MPRASRPTEFRCVTVARLRATYGRRLPRWHLDPAPDHPLALPSALASGEWVTAAGAGGVAYIAREDLALAAAVALASGSSGNRTFTLTGTQALNAREIAAKVSAATGSPLTVVDVTAEQLAEGLRAHGFPPVLADVFTSFDVATAAGDLAEVTDDFATLTGRGPSTFDAWLPANLALLAKAH